MFTRHDETIAALEALCEEIDSIDIHNVDLNDESDHQRNLQALLLYAGRVQQSSRTLRSVLANEVQPSEPTTGTIQSAASGAGGLATPEATPQVVRHREVTSLRPMPQPPRPRTQLPRTQLPPDVKDVKYNLGKVGANLDRFNTPAIDKMKTLGPQELAVLVALRSTDAFVNVASLLDERAAPGELPAKWDPENASEEKWWTKCVALLEFAATEKKKELLGRYATRWCRFDLYQTLASRRHPNMQHFRVGDVAAIAARWAALPDNKGRDADEKRVQKELATGKTLMLLVGGHHGLLPFLPIRAMPQFGIKVNDIDKLASARAAGVWECMGDDYARRLCVLGQRIHQHLVGGNRDSDEPGILSLAGRNIDYEAMSMNELYNLQIPLEKGLCDCKRGEAPFY